MWVFLLYSLCFYKKKKRQNYQVRLLDSCTPKADVQASPAGNKPRPPAASDQKVVTVLPTTAHPAGAHSGTQITVQGSPKGTPHSYIQTAETPLPPALSFPVTHFVHPPLTKCRMLSAECSLSYFDSKGSFPLSPSVILQPERLDRHLGSAAGEDQLKAGR